MTTKSGETLLYEKEAYAIRGACFEVYRQFGGAFKESVIQNALELEFKARGLEIETQKRIDLTYRGEKIGLYVPDFIVEGRILIELKAKPFITKDDERQFWHYLHASDFKLGFLVNFGSRRLEIRRRVYERARIRANPRIDPRVSASILIMVIGSLLWRQVMAQISPSLSVSPDRLFLSVSRGEVIEEELRIANNGTAAIPIHVRPVRWEASDEVGGINFVATKEDISFDVAQWITFAKNDFILDPKEQETIPFTITVPKEAEPGGKYGGIFIEPQLPEFYFESGAARVIPSVVTLLLIDIPVFGLDIEATPKLSVAEFSVAQKSTILSSAASFAASFFQGPVSVFAEGPTVKVNVLSKKASELIIRLTNSGITHVRPAGTVTIHNLFGVKAAQAAFEPTTILPGTTRRITVDFGKAGFLASQLAFGRYTATAVIGGLGEEPVVATMAYWVFPWPLVSTMIVLLVVVYLARRRIGAAVKALVGH